MIKVNLIAHTNVKPLELASHAALKCYQAENPEWGKVIDVENRLFNVGHHTTLEHFFFTFSIEGIAVGDITFGMHLTHPFYNSDQRSGRYCAKMFLEPNYKEIENYIKKFWPEVNTKNRNSVINYVKKGVELYHKNIGEATQVVEKFLKSERPYASQKYLEMNAAKIAQEQLRMFIPVIFPTGFDFSVNLTVLAAMHRTAWTPSMRYVTGQMARAVTKKFPELSFAFSRKNILNQDWAPEAPKTSAVRVKYKPAHKLLGLIYDKDFISPEMEKMHPLDLLHFDPEMLDNSSGEILTKAEISVATMGQDQRHRTIRRSAPKFTGAFYLPPVLKFARLEKEARDIMKQWIGLSGKVPKTLAMILAPYGAMVEYKKSGSYNAIAHEQAKRLCFCAQEEIYHAGRALRMDLEKSKGKNSKLLRMFEPPCFRSGRCAEGTRYCGREIKLRKTGNYFPERKV